MTAQAPISPQQVLHCEQGLGFVGAVGGGCEEMGDTRGLCSWMTMVSIRGAIAQQSRVLGGGLGLRQIRHRLGGNSGLTWTRGWGIVSGGK